MRFVLGKDISRISHWDQAVYELWWPSQTKDLQTEPKEVLCVGVVEKRHSAWFTPTDELTMFGVY